MTLSLHCPVIESYIKHGALELKGFFEFRAKLTCCAANLKIVELVSQEWFILEED